MRKEVKIELKFNYASTYDLRYLGGMLIAKEKKTFK